MYTLDVMEYALICILSSLAEPIHVDLQGKQFVMHAVECCKKSLTLVINKKPDGYIR